MGAASSLLNNNAELDIYVSYPEKTEYVTKMMDTLQTMNFKVMDSSIMIQSRKDLSVSDISKYMEIFIEKTKYIFVCISSNTIKSVTQIMEINEIMDKYPIKIIYFMMDQSYTPITNVELNSIIKKNLWYPIYDEDSLLYTTNKLLTILMNKNDELEPDNESYNVDEPENGND
jgi:hypothetical protein